MKIQGLAGFKPTPAELNGHKHLFSSKAFQSIKERGTMTEEKKPAGFVIDQTVRQRLLASAAKLFARKGYASTTVREIVEAAGVTKPVLYYYFPNKEGIYLEMMRGAWDRFDALLEGCPERIRGC